MTAILLLLFLVADINNAASINSTNIPSNWPSCMQEEKEERDLCLKNAVTVALTEIMSTGNKALGISPLEPMHFTQIGFKTSGPVAVKLVFSNVNITNVSSIEIISVDSELEDFLISFKVKFTKPLSVIGNYVINGKVLLLPIVGNGNCNITFYNVEATSVLYGVEKTIKDENHIDFRKGTFNFKPSNMSIHLSNLFNGDKALGDNMNKFLNENWSLLIDELTPPFSTAFGEVLRAIANRIMDKIPVSDIVHGYEK